ncbi:phage tail spike protein [Lactovum miscens]|uniref:Phage minor structural protein n=1 Tax=Lactovum miscens TaxID=190387 RepID=A0A841C4L0_9LACT|nr:phage tail spike protein [Lactovum miscens]MBB5887753.1 phage minor structural protein [Lactovum miscens]
MQLNIHGTNLKIVGFIDNDIPGLPSFFNDNFHTYLAEGAATFDFTVNKFKKGVLQDYCQYLNEQSYISLNYNSRDYLFYVANLIDNDQFITLSCESLNLEMINENVNPFTSTTAQTIEWYIASMGILSYAKITLGINELSSLTKTLSYDSQDTKLARLLALVGDFGGEFEFITALNSDGTLQSITLNLYRANDGNQIQGVGKKRDDVTLFYGKNVVGIERQVDKTQIFNATTVTDSNDAVNWNASAWSVNNANGQEEFYKRAGSDTAYAPLSNVMYPSQTSSDSSDTWIRKDLSASATSADDLWAYALSQFKLYAYAIVTYVVTASSKLLSETVGNGTPLAIGDTIIIQDDNFPSGLILSARVSEMQISFSNPANNVITFSNFTKLQSQVSDDLISQMNALVDAATPYRCEVWTTNGTSFKNGTGSTELQAHVFKGSDVTEVTPDTIQWIADGTPISSGNGGNSPNLTVNASEIFQKSVISYQATFGTRTYNSPDITMLDVSDGTSPINLVIESSNGYQFKNNIINTVLTARLYQDNNEIDTDGTEFVYVWTKINADGAVDTTWNLQHQAGSKSITITNSDLQQRATFDCVATSLF